MISPDLSFKVFLKEDLKPLSPSFISNPKLIVMVEKLSLNWNDYSVNVTRTFPHPRNKEGFFDLGQL